MNNNIWIINQYSGSKYHKKEDRSLSISDEYAKFCDILNPELILNIPLYKKVKIYN